MSAQSKQAPEIIGMKVGNLRPLVQEWIDKNPNIPLSVLLRKGLKMALKPLAGKKHAHLVEMN